MKEKFVDDKDITLFTGELLKVWQDYYLMTDEVQHRSNINIKDTVVNPNGWEDCSFIIGYKRFDENGSLCIFFGKKYANEKDYKGSIEITRKKVTFNFKNESKMFLYDIPYQGKIKIIIKNNFLEFTIAEFFASVKIEKEDIIGYTGFSFKNGQFFLNEFEIESKIKPYDIKTSNEKLIKWRHEKLEITDRILDAFEKFTKSNPELFSKSDGNIIIDHKVADIGETVKVKTISYGNDCMSIVVTHNCMGNEPIIETIKTNPIKVSDHFEFDFDLKLHTAGNTKVELWINREERTVRQIAVLDKEYMAVIPWIGSNNPYLDDEIHRYDLPGDYWFNGSCEGDFEERAKKEYKFIKNSKKYGDRLVPFINAKDIISLSETSNMFELDPETQRRGLKQYIRRMEILGIKEHELVASYTPDAVTVNIMEEVGFKAMTSLCIWQNWQDGGWKINHWGASNQPYYPAEDDFRRGGKKRDIMCFSMGNSSCVRNYSIMAMDGCPTLNVPNERYYKPCVQHFQLQRFYDTFDGYVADNKNTDELLTVTICLEGFSGKSDWKVANDLSVRYMVNKAKTEKIVFSSAADIADYHMRKKMNMQRAYFYQGDCYYGYHNGDLPGRIADRIEVNTPEYLAVLKKGESLPLYFYDHTKKWKSGNKAFENAQRTVFGLVNPDEFDTSLYLPTQVERNDIKITNTLKDNKLNVKIISKSEKDLMVTAVFDIPYDNDLSCLCERKDIIIRKISDYRTLNISLLIEIKNIKVGTESFDIILNGNKRDPYNNEFIKDEFGMLFIENHAYLRSMDKEKAIEVTFYNVKDIYCIQQDGTKIYPDCGSLKIKINEDWFNEAPIIYGIDKIIFETMQKKITVKVIGDSKTSRWSWDLQ